MQTCKWFIYINWYNVVDKNLNQKFICFFRMCFLKGSYWLKSHIMWHFSLFFWGGIEPINRRFLRKARIVQFLPVQVSTNAEENRKNVILRSGIDFMWLNICLLSLIFMLQTLSYFIWCMMNAILEEEMYDNFVMKTWWNISVYLFELTWFSFFSILNTYSMYTYIPTHRFHSQ